MDEDGGGGGGGDGGGGFGYMNVPSSPFVYMSHSPLNDKNRFLEEQNNFSYQNQSDLTILDNKDDNSIPYGAPTDNFFQGQNNFSCQNSSNPTILDNKNNYNSNGVCEFSSSLPFSGATNRSFVSSSPFSTGSGSSDLGVGFTKDFDDDGINQRWTKELKRTLLEGPGREESGSRKEFKPRNKGQKNEKGIPKGFIKGQWTEQEDRRLMRLVLKNGELRWAEIAEQMVGRAGKQCRERWQNHLRPELKKSLWTEEEEKMLVEAHQILGNKWAEIAKRIPGRSENSIKNHWNATKRRQMAKGQIARRNRKNNLQPRSNFLEEYIKTLIANSNDQNTSSTSTDLNAASTTTPDDTLLGPTETSDELNITQPMSVDSPDWMDELSITQTMFANSYNYDDYSLFPMEEPQQNYPYSDPSFSSYLQEGNGNVVSNNFPNKEAEQFDPYSNFCSSFLLEENIDNEKAQEMYPYSNAASNNNLLSTEEALANYRESNLSFSSWLNGNGDGTGTSTSVPGSSSNCNFSDGINFGFNDNQEGGSSSSQMGEMDLMEMARFHFPNNNI